MFITRPDAQLYTLSFGQGPLTLLALGGWVAGGEIWHPLFGELPHWRCVSVDHRGSGASTHSGPITLDAMADDLLAVADALGLDRCVLAAESAGAAVALRAVQRAPQRFIGQVLVGAAWQHTAADASRAWVQGLRSDLAGTLRVFIDNCLPETPSRELRRWALQMLMCSSADDAIELLRVRERIAPDETFDAPALPTLLVHGSEDRIVPVQSSRQLAALLPRAELQVLPGLGHVPLVTAARQVAALIDRFAQPLLLP